MKISIKTERKEKTKEKWMRKEERKKIVWHFLGDAIKVINLIVIGDFLLSYLYRFICLWDAIGLNKIKINPQAILIRMMCAVEDMMCGASMKMELMLCKWILTDSKAHFIGYMLETSQFQIIGVWGVIYNAKNKTVSKIKSRKPLKLKVLENLGNTLHSCLFNVFLNAAKLW